MQRGEGLKGCGWRTARGGRGKADKEGWGLKLGAESGGNSGFGTTAKWVCLCVLWEKETGKETDETVVGQDGHSWQGLKEELRKIGLLAAVLDRKREKTKQRCTEDMPEQEQGGSETLSQTRQTGRGCSGDESSRRRKHKKANRN